MLVYKIYNDINTKIYIGQTTLSLEERIQRYKKELKYRPNSRPIIRAMNKYGFNHIFFEIVKDNIQTRQELDTYERYYIKYYQSLITEKGYNVELGGSGNGKHSEETKQKISEAQRGEKIICIM